jgi:hypothetical protein
MGSATRIFAERFNVKVAATLLPLSQRAAGRHDRYRESREANTLSPFGRATVLEVKRFVGMTKVYFVSAWHSGW